MSSPYEESILRSLRRISRAIDLHSRQLVTRHRLTAPQLVCLRQLEREGGESTPGGLARAIHLSQATVTGILDRLSARGLVSRERSASDRRRVNVRLTPRGQAIVAAAPSPLHERFAERLAQLPEPQQARINEVLHQIVLMMEAEHIDASPLWASGGMTEEPPELEGNGHPKAGDEVAAKDDREQE